MSEFWEPKIKVFKVDIKVLLQKCWVGPPISRNVSDGTNPSTSRSGIGIVSSCSPTLPFGCIWKGSIGNTWQANTPNFRE